MKGKKIMELTTLFPGWWCLFVYLLRMAKLIPWIFSRCCPRRFATTSPSMPRMRATRSWAVGTMQSANWLNSSSVTGFMYSPTASNIKMNQTSYYGVMVTSEIYTTSTLPMQFLPLLSPGQTDNHWLRYCKVVSRLKKSPRLPACVFSQIIVRLLGPWSLGICLDTNLRLTIIFVRCLLN